MGMLLRHPENPLIRAEDVPPTSKEYRVLGAFNPAAAEYKGEVLLLLRVAESCIPEKGYFSVLYYDVSEDAARPEVLRFKKNDPHVSQRDSRFVTYKGIDYLSSLSHLRLARSRDGVHFKVDKSPFIYPTLESEAFGVEDARICLMGDEFWINYTAVSKDGFCTILALTRDFISLEKKGIIYPPMNKDVALFSEPCGGKYYCLHRPDNNGFGRPSIWIGSSPDLLHWGDNKCLLRPDNSPRESMKIGGGAPPVITDEGWLCVYHGQGDNGTYTLNTLLLDRDNPEKIIGRGKSALLKPEESYETGGFFSNVVFTNGMLVREDKGVKTAWIYYGAGDDSVCLARAPLDDLVSHALDRH